MQFIGPLNELYHNNNTHSRHQNWQNHHHDVGSSLEVFWWHCMDLHHFMYWQDGGNERSGCIDGGVGAMGTKGQTVLVAAAAAAPSCIR